MKITRLRRHSKNIIEFQKEEWKYADIEHYGQPTDWKTAKMLLQVTINRKIVGTLTLKMHVGVAEIETLIVEHTTRGQGIGTKLVLEAEKVARENNCHKLFLITGKNWKSVPFYLKMGYQQTGELRNHYHGHDFIEFSKFL